MNAKSSKNNCLICGAPTKAFFDPVLNFSCDECTQCHAVFKPDDAYVDYKEEKRLYDFHDNSMENQGYVDYLKRYLNEALYPFVQKNSHGLDFGSGPGPVLYELLKQTGFEMNHYDPYYHNDETVLSARYDFVTSTEVFEHLQHPRSVMERLSTMVKAEGILSIQTSFYPENHEAFFKWWYRRDPTHIVFYTLKSFEVLARDFNFTLVYTNDKNIVVLRKNKEEKR